MLCCLPPPSRSRQPIMEALCCQINPDCHMVAAGCRDGRVRVASTKEGVGLMHTLGDRFPGAVSPCCTALRWRPESWHSSETRNILLAARVREAGPPCSLSICFRNPSPVGLKHSCWGAPGAMVIERHMRSGWTEPI